MSITAWFTACQWLLLCGQTDCHPRKKRKLWRVQFLFVVWNFCGFLQLQKLAADWAKIISIYSPKKKLMNFRGSFVTFFFTTVCNQFSRGVFSMLGAVSPESFDTLHSYSNTFQMPFVTPWFPEKVSTWPDHYLFCKLRKTKQEENIEEVFMFRRKWRAWVQRELDRIENRNVVADYYYYVFFFINITSPTSFVWLVYSMKNADFQTHWTIEQGEWRKSNRKFSTRFRFWSRTHRPIDCSGSPRGVISFYFCIGGTFTLRLWLFHYIEIDNRNENLSLSRYDLVSY